MLTGLVAMAMMDNVEFLTKFIQQSFLLCDDTGISISIIGHGHRKITDNFQDGFQNCTRLG